MLWPSVVAKGSWLSTSDPKSVHHSIRMTKAEGLAFGSFTIVEKISLSLPIQALLPVILSVAEGFLVQLSAIAEQNKFSASDLETLRHPIF